MANQTGPGRLSNRNMAWIWLGSGLLFLISGVIGRLGGTSKTMSAMIIMLGFSSQTVGLMLWRRAGRSAGSPPGDDRTSGR